MDKLLEISSPLFFDEVVAIHKKVYEHVRALEESSFSWMDEILDDARRAVNQSDVCLLPKTPSAKQKGRRKKKSNQTARRQIQIEEQDDYLPPQEEKQKRSSKQAKKRIQPDVLSDDDFEDEPSSKVSKLQTSPAGRKTRAASRAATTSRARNTRAAKKTTKNKSKSQEPIAILEQIVQAEKELLTVTPKQKNRDEEEMDVSVHEVIDIWTQSANKVIKPPGESARKKRVSELEESVYEMEETWSQPADALVIKPPEVLKNSGVKLLNANTPIQNFSSMNVKEKVHAYEEIIIISPMTAGAKTKSVSPQKNNIVRTPNNASIPQTTPDTVVEKIRVVDSSETVHKDDLQDTPTTKVNKSSKNTVESSVSRKSSVHRSLKVLPSTAKHQAVHAEPEAKPVRARTRLRLKKKEQKVVESESEQEMTSSITSENKTDSECQDDMEGNTEQVEQPSTPENRRKTRSQGRASVEESEQNSGRSSHLGDAEASESDHNTEEEVSHTPPKPARSTRTKTRQAQNQHALAEAEKSSNKDSGKGSEYITGVGGSSSSVDGDGTPRVTRSKMRKPKTTAADITDSDSAAFASPAVPRVTRTKTRKRQHDEDNDRGRQAKRSCTSDISMASDAADDKPNGGNTDEDSSDGEVLSPKCPPTKVVRPVPSFLNSLNKNSHNPIRPANLNTGGLVKSFIARNSPAPKPTLLEIQEKRKQELHEKEKKEKERLKKREEEHKKKMEEMRKKREEKMKKVHEMRELRQQKEKENRLHIEKRLAEKRQLTQKIREEKIKEDKEKQKLRLQKMEEAEERRKQDDEERRKKLQEQREQEKVHDEMLQRKKEFEEHERLQKIEDEKKRATERQQEIEREREKERERLMKIEEDKKKEWQKKREERERQAAQERAEKEKLEMEKKKDRELQMKKEMERIREQERLRIAEQEKIKEQHRKRDEELKKMVEKHNTQVQQNKQQLPKPNMNKTHSLNEPSVEHNSSANNDSYEMTPKKVPMASTMENYGIDDLNSGDETDDDECPRKKIPDWAQGSQLKTLLIKQHYHPPNLDELFDVIEAPDLNVLFEKKKARFNKRTSSAHWDSPILRPGLLGRV